MYRECGLKRISWTEKTMSMMKAEETDACEAFLKGLPVHGIFDAECTFSDAEKLYAASFFAMEKPVPDSIITPEVLRNEILRTLPMELLLLSPPEHELLLKLIFFGGKMKLMNDGDIDAAASLSARLWIKASSAGDRIEITMPRQLLTTAVLVLAGDKYKECRNLISSVDDSINRTLYLYGFMQVNGPFNHLRNAVREITDSVPEDRSLYRFFRTSYEYTFSPDGIMLLVHPGLACIDFNDPAFPLRNDAMVETDEESLRAVITQLEPQEQPLYDQMNAVLNGYVRPEIPTEDAVEDLIMLAKQNVPESEMKKVLDDLISGIPASDMKVALHNIHERTPRWILLSSSRLQ